MKEKEGNILKFKKKRILTLLLTFPNFLVLLVDIILLYHNATPGESLNSVKFYWNGDITVTRKLVISLGKRFASLHPTSLQNSLLNRCKLSGKRNKERDLKM